MSIRGSLIVPRLVQVVGRAYIHVCGTRYVDRPFLGDIYMVLGELVLRKIDDQSTRSFMFVSQYNSTFGHLDTDHFPATYYGTLKDCMVVDMHMAKSRVVPFSRCN